MRPRSIAARRAASRRKPPFPQASQRLRNKAERIRAAAIYLNVQRLIPEDRVHGLGERQGGGVHASSGAYWRSCRASAGAPSRRNRLSRHTAT
jgi:hypothetical protein